MLNSIELIKVCQIILNRFYFNRIISKSINLYKNYIYLFNLDLKLRLDTHTICFVRKKNNIKF